MFLQWSTAGTPHFGRRHYSISLSLSLSERSGALEKRKRGDRSGLGLARPRREK